MMLENLGFKTIIELANIDRIISYDDFWSIQNDHIKQNRQIAIDTAYKSFEIGIIPLLDQYITELDFCNSLSLELEINTKLLKAFRIEEEHIHQFTSKFKDSYSSINQDIEALKRLEDIATQHNLELIKVSGDNQIENEKFSNAIVTIDIFDNGKDMLIDKLLQIKSKLSTTGLITVDKITETNLVFCVLSHDKTSIEKLMSFKEKRIYFNDLSTTYDFTFLDLILFNSMLVPLLKQDLAIESFSKIIGESIFTSAYTKAMLHRNEIYKRTLERIVFTDAFSINAAMIESYIEGSCINDYITRKIDASYLKTLREIYDNFTHMDNNLKVLEIASHKAYYSNNAHKFKTNQMTNNQHKKIIEDYRKSKLDFSERNLSDYLIIDYTVNNSYKNPDFGDLFYITDSQSCSYYATLVSMPCDNSIRLPLKISNNYFAARKNTKFELVKLKLIEDVKIKLDNFTSLIFPINHNSICRTFQSTSELIQLPLFMLDYCSFDEKGKFPVLENQFKINEQICSTTFRYKSHLSYEYYKILQLDTETTFNEIYNEIHKYIKELHDQQSINALFCSHMSRLYGVKFEENRYCIERVGRLRNDIAYNILKEYTSNILRVGLDTTLPGEN